MKNHMGIHMRQTMSDVATQFVNNSLFDTIEWCVDQAGQTVDAGLVGACPDHADPIYRIYSMTKPIVSVLALMLIERGYFTLATPIAQFDLNFTNMRVLDDTGRIEPTGTLITIEHLLTHQAGLSYDFSRGCTVAPYYREMGFLERADRDLTDAMAELAQLPLAFHPGTSWRYSVATDVLAHIIETATGQRLDDLLRECLFNPLGMLDTGFYVADTERPRVMRMFGTQDLHGLPPLDPRPHVLSEIDVSKTAPMDAPNFRRGGHGLFSTMGDYMKFANMLLTGKFPDGTPALSAPMHAMMRAPRVPFGARGMRINDDPFVGYGWNLIGRVMIDLGRADRMTSLGEFGWSGAAATYFWVDPISQVTGCIMTQFLGNQHPLAIKMQSAAMMPLDV